MQELDVKPLRKWVPESIEFEELDEEDIWILKEGTRDNTLEPYLRDGTVKVLESRQMDGPVLEKRVNKRTEDPLREVAFSVLMDEVGSTKKKVAPSISYVREEDGDIFYGQEFLTNFGPLNDQKLNNIDDAEEYLEAAGEITGTYNWLDIMHGDLVKIYTSGPLRGFPESKNILFSGSSPEAMGIDLETAFFDDEHRSIANHQSGLYEMNPKRSDEEYDALRRVMELNVIARHLPDYFDRITETPLRTQQGEFNRNVFLRYEDEEDADIPGRNEYMIDFGKLQEQEEELTGSINTTLADKLRSLDSAYEKGFDALSQDLRGRNGDFSAGFLKEADVYSTIPTNITREQVRNEGVSDIARMRWEEVYNALDDSYSGL